MSSNNPKLFDRALLSSTSDGDGKYVHVEGIITGITLRDLFAMAALNGLVTGITSMNNAGIITHRPNSNDCSQIAYGYADAMLAAREKR